MEVFLRYFEERRDEILELRSRPGVHAVEIDYDETWLAMWSAVGAQPDLADEVRSLWYRYREFGLPGWVGEGPLGRPGATGSGDRRWSPNLCGGPPRTVNEAEDIAHRLVEYGWPEGRSPFVVRLVLYPGAPIPPVDSTGLRIEFTARRPPEGLSSTVAPAAVLSGGDRMQGTSSRHSGTIGGFLADDTGVTVAVTCAHVIDAGEDVECDVGAGAEIVGSVVHRSPLVPWAGQVGGCHNTTDVALLAITRANLGTVDQPSPIEPQPQVPRTRQQASVRARGATHPLEASNLQVEPDVLFDGVLHRFEFLGQFFPDLNCANPIIDGDSGAWIIQEEYDVVSGISRNLWVGTVVASDARQVFATLAPDTLLEARRHNGNLVIS